MEESVRRHLSRLWLFQAVVFALLGYIPRLSGLNCYCYEEPNNGFPLCFFEDDTCTGDVCYARKELRDDGEFFSTWNCLSKAMGHHIDLICNTGAFNSDTDEYVCCTDGDYCNRDIRIELPIERPTTEAVTSAPSATEEVGSGSGSSPLDPSTITTEPNDAVLETTSRSTPVTSQPISRPPSTPTTSTTGDISRPSTTTQSQDASLKCFCSTCPTNQSSCGPNSKCYVGKDFGPRQDVNSTAAVISPQSYSWGCFNESEVATKCREMDKYSCCSDKDFCNEHLPLPPLKCFCTSGTCPGGQDYVSCGANTTCYVSLPSDSSSTNATPDSLIWGCFNQSETKVKCNDTQRYNCCSDRDYCNKDLDPPTRRNEEECTSASGGCQTKQRQDFISIPVVASVMTVVAVLLVAIVALIVVLLVRIQRLKQGQPVKSNSSTSDSSENSVTTESESLPSPTSASSPHHHYLHITADDPAFGDSLNKCNGSKA